MLDEIERLMQEVKGVCDNIAHDLRTPLTRLLAGLERAGRRAHSVDEYAVAADEAAVETRGILKTFAAMLRISEIESTARRAGFTGVDLSQVVADVIEFYEPMAEENGISLQIETSGSAAVMRGDPESGIRSDCEPCGQCAQIHSAWRSRDRTHLNRDRNPGHRRHG